MMPLPSFMMSREAMTTSMSVLGSPGVAESLAMAPLSLAMALGPAAPTRPMVVVGCGLRVRLGQFRGSRIVSSCSVLQSKKCMSLRPTHAHSNTLSHSFVPSVVLRSSQVGQ